MSCPAPDSLLPLALGAGDPAIARHVAGCLACQAELGRIRELAGGLRGARAFDSLAASADCLDELTLADFVDGRLEPDARDPVVAHLAGCARCRSIVRATGRVLTDPELSGKASPHRPFRWVLPLGAVAAAALLVLLPRYFGERRPRPGLREPPLTTTIAPVLIAPAAHAAVGRLDRLVWSSVPHAERYRLRLFSADGALRWSVETSDTSAALPDSVALVPGATYFWKVDAATEWRRWVASDLTEFRLLPPR